jgi:predicted regulator of amino acid metabolism with ACT domain
MTNIQQKVTNFIEHDVSIRRGLTRDLINTRALAKYIQENLGLSGSLDAVISAIRRYETQDKSKEDIYKRYKIIAGSKVSSRSRMAAVLYRKEMEVRKSLIRLYSKIDFTAGEVLRILEVTQYIKVILDESNLKLVEDIFPKQEILGIEKRLGEISIVYSKEVVDTPGVFSALAGELALNNISIRDGVICGPEHIFIIKEDDLMSALTALHNIASWGDRN